MTGTVGDRIVAERDRLGIQQGDICAWTGVSRRTQFAYEQGERFPDASYLITLIEHGFDVPYILTGKRPPRYGAIDEDLLRSVFSAVEAALSDAGQTIDTGKKAKLVALVYQTSAENGQVDPLVVQKAVGLIGN
ncbi:helix-turn-helix domain-containing protein [Burkholderia sp. 4M9327F10]|uniref:helix-turn-helix domain-containing protein n=1 Tax=Burkholderia sp. 4M9327F10 TaxID=2502223 RepID=UPI0010F7C463|nr:helix-turn-helix domain-containing protein [Burkholderia sp. 4M9327F10]